MPLFLGESIGQHRRGKGVIEEEDRRWEQVRKAHVLRFEKWDVLRVNEWGNEDLRGLWCCLMERPDSIASHSPSRGECPDLPWAAILTMGEERLLLYFLLNHRSRLDNPLSDLQRIVTVNPAQSRDKLYSQVFRIPKDTNFITSLGTKSTALIQPLLKKRKRKRKKSLYQYTLEATAVGISRLAMHDLDFGLAHPEISDLPSGYLDCNYSWCQSTTKLIKRA